jgi:hypothetical protein
LLLPRRTEVGRVESIDCELLLNLEMVTPPDATLSRSRESWKLCLVNKRRGSTRERKEIPSRTALIKTVVGLSIS